MSTGMFRYTEKESVFEVSTKSWWLTLNTFWFLKDILFFFISDRFLCLHFFNVSLTGWSFFLVFSLYILRHCLCQKVANIVRTPFLLGEGLSLLPNFQQWGLDRTSVFRGGLLGKREEGRGWLFSGGGGGVQFFNKKSEIFNDKKSL